MLTKRKLIYTAVAFFISFSATFFVIKSNDHKECKIVIKKELDKNGNTITKKEHICKEKYSF